MPTEDQLMEISKRDKKVSDSDLDFRIIFFTFVRVNTFAWDDANI